MPQNYSFFPNQTQSFSDCNYRIGSQELWIEPQSSLYYEANGKKKKKKKESANCSSSSTMGT